MPIYEYVCKSCGKTEEKILSTFNAPNMAECECGGAAERIISPAAFHLKGSGWYSTDYKGKKPLKEKKDEGVCPASKSDNPACAACEKSGVVAQN